jgi:hypothetical protein
LPGDARRLGNSAVDHGGHEPTSHPVCQNRPVPGVSSGAYRRYALVYDLVWRAAPYDRFVDLCLDAAAAHGTGVRRVLVAACGTGNAALELAGRGLDVAGFDLSPAMVAMAAAKPWPAGRRPGCWWATSPPCPCATAGPTWSWSSTPASTTCSSRPGGGLPADTWAGRPGAAAWSWSSRCRRGSCTRAGSRAATSTATACAWTPPTRSRATW